jgi:hypothetical protein
MRVHQYVPVDRTFHVHALVPPGNRYYVEVVLRYTAVAPSRYLAGWHESGVVASERFVQTLDGLDVRIRCGEGMRYDMHMDHCVSAMAVLRSVWFLLYAFGCVLTTALLICVCRLRARSIAARQNSH